MNFPGFTYPPPNAQREVVDTKNPRNSYPPPQKKKTKLNTEVVDTKNPRNSYPPPFGYPPPRVLVLLCCYELLSYESLSYESLTYYTTTA